MRGSGIQEDQWNGVVAVCAPPDRGEQDSFGVDLLEGGEVEQAFRVGASRLGEHVSQPAFSGRDDQPASAAVAEALFVGSVSYTHLTLPTTPYV